MRHNNPVRKQTPNERTKTFIMSTKCLMDVKAETKQHKLSEQLIDLTADTSQQETLVPIGVYFTSQVKQSSSHRCVWNYWAWFLQVSHAVPQLATRWKQRSMKCRSGNLREEPEFCVCIRERCKS